MFQRQDGVFSDRDNKVGVNHWEQIHCVNRKEEMWFT